MWLPLFKKFCLEVVHDFAHINSDHFKDFPKHHSEYKHMNLVLLMLLKTKLLMPFDSMLKTKQTETQMIIWRFKWPCLTDDSLDFKHVCKSVKTVKDV